MTQSPTRRTAGVNALLARISATDGGFLASGARSERPPRGQVLSGRTNPAGELWFPVSGVIALSITDAEGRTAQSGLVGPEGCIGLETLYGQPPALVDATVQVSGEMAVIPGGHARAAVEANSVVEATFAGFLYQLAAQSLQTVACNRLHSLDSRCCRWLLMMQDRTGGQDLSLTQESLATMLGSWRPRINGLLATLESEDLVRRYRGRVRLVSRLGLERRACDCYRLLHRAPKLSPGGQVL
jgi:CRP-like cAMP-binding protein